MRIPKIVITGGPCAGKSSAMNTLQEELTKQGYKVLTIAESATQFMSSGAKYSDPKFQRYLIEYQLQKERICEEFARHQENPIIVLDRGCLDCKAYMPLDEWRSVLKELHTDEIEIRDSYDAVFHLVSTAKNKSSIYTQENNAARFENKEEAITADDAVLDVWASHPNRVIIDNFDKFEDKVKKLTTEIVSFLNT